MKAGEKLQFIKGLFSIGPESREPRHMSLLSPDSFVVVCVVQCTPLPNVQK